MWNFFSQPSSTLQSGNLEASILTLPTGGSGGGEYRYQYSGICGDSIGTIIRVHSLTLPCPAVGKFESPATAWPQRPRRKAHRFGRISAALPFAHPKPKGRGVFLLQRRHLWDFA